MGTIVLKMTAEQISVLQKDLASYATATKNPYASFSAKVDGTSVIAYTSGKVTFQGAKPEILASRFGYQATPKQSTDCLLYTSGKPQWEVFLSVEWSLHGDRS